MTAAADYFADRFQDIKKTRGRRIYTHYTNATTVFEDFIARFLQHCGRWPEPKSVLVMDNASFHHSESIAQMCAEAGVKLVYLPPYSPDLNPIEEFFAEFKSFYQT